MDAAVVAGDMKAWVKADGAFHEALIAGAGNTRLAHAARLFIDQSHRVRMHTLTLRPLPRESNRDHATLIEAMKRGDGAEAFRIQQDHRMRGGLMMAELLAAPGGRA
jgi:DNA-binding GntR family transcriptional regulator